MRTPPTPAPPKASRWTPEATSTAPKWGPRRSRSTSSYEEAGMDVKLEVSRRRFVGGITTLLGYITLRPSGELFSHGAMPRPRIGVDEYDGMAKLASNENPYGPPDSVLKAMTNAFKYANRYSYPDGEIVAAIAKHHGVPPENVMLGSGS